MVYVCEWLCAYVSVDSVSVFIDSCIYIIYTWSLATPTSSPSPFLTPHPPSPPLPAEGELEVAMSVTNQLEKLRKEGGDQWLSIFNAERVRSIEDRGGDKVRSATVPDRCRPDRCRPDRCQPDRCRPDR